ncbi:MAG TPA: orotate phosphoribosyltransferase [Bacteroidales bacterium]|nr:orotate phosphoribosyltransferase [Bacteroidales bacterium]HPS63096.1 orotate phosphoribosyltransferase [Bacteroidales bacterium]
MIYNKDVALKTAELLLKIKAVKLNPKDPFTWASGIKSPIYCDNRITLSYPEIRTFLRQHFVRAIAENHFSPEAISGVATGGISQGVLVAQELGLPFSYVRTGKKDHGLLNQVEGEVREGQRIVVIEDLISTGGSSLGAVEALRAAGCNIKGMLAIFTYDLPVAQKAFREADCQLITLTDYDHLIQKALEVGYIDTDGVQVLQDFRKSLGQQ